MISILKWNSIIFPSETQIWSSLRFSISPAGTPLMAYWLNEWGKETRDIFCGIEFHLISLSLQTSEVFLWEDGFFSLVCLLHNVGERWWRRKRWWREKEQHVEALVWHQMKMDTPNAAVSDSQRLIRVNRWSHRLQRALRQRDRRFESQVECVQLEISQCYYELFISRLVEKRDQRLVYL